MEFKTHSASMMKLHMLPMDALIAIASCLMPRDLLSLASAHPNFRHLGALACIWSSLAQKRLLALSDVHSKDAFIAAAKSLNGRCRVLCGTIVSGFPVLFRSGIFVTIRARAGVEKPIGLLRDDTAGYVMRRDFTSPEFFHPHSLHRLGKPSTSSMHFNDPSLPCYTSMFGSAPSLALTSSPTVSTPCLEIDFKFGCSKPNSPYPVDGVLLRIVHGIQVEAGMSKETARERVAIDITVNGMFLTSREQVHPDGLGACVARDYVISPDLLHPTTRVNTLAVMLGGAGGVFYWIKEVSMSPVVLGLPEFNRLTDGGSLPLAIPPLPSKSSNCRSCKYFGSPVTPPFSRR